MVCVIYLVNVIAFRLYSEDSMCHVLSTQFPSMAFVLQLRYAV